MQLRVPRVFTSLVFTSLMMMTLVSIGIASGKEYPQRGTVTAVNVEHIPRTAWTVHTYRLKSEDAVYVFRDWNYGQKASLAIGASVYFRITGEVVYVQTGNKERKYSLAGIEQIEH